MTKIIMLHAYNYYDNIIIIIISIIIIIIIIIERINIHSLQIINNI